MRSLTLPLAAAPRWPARRPATAAFARGGVDLLLAVALLALGTGLLAFLPGAFSVDSWLGLVTGREVWQSGLPHHEVLTSLAQGTVWIDQQWLSQLLTYALYLLGGLGLLGLVNVALIVTGVSGAVLAARRLGASARQVLLALPLALWLVIPSHEVRTQSFVIPLFVATAYLLATDSRHPSRRVYWCLPLLVLWANLHGTVTLGAALVALRGLNVAWERRSSLRAWRAWRRPVALTGGAALCLLLTPYGLGIVAYYHTMFLGSTVMSAVTEWQPITSVGILAVPFFLTAALALWCFGRHPSTTTAWERLALLLLAAGSVAVIRNLLFFGLFCAMVLPLALGSIGAAPAAPRRVGAPARGRGPLNAALCLAALFALTVAVVATLLRAPASIELRGQRLGVLYAVERATRTDRSLHVLADVRFADWLLWRDPVLGGRIANDARWELVTPSQMAALQATFAVVGTGWKRGARGDRLLVLDRRYDGAASAAFLAEPGARALYDDGARLVILRTTRAAA